MSSFDVKLDSVRKLAELLKETGLHEIEYAEGERRIRCVASPAPSGLVTHVATVNPAVLPGGASGGASSPQTTNIAPSAESKQPAGTVITSPMVGTAYMAPEPGSPTFVSVGSTVREGDTLLILEAMKVMNPIKATVSGVVAAIFVSDSQPVEFGEKLMIIE